MQSRFSNMELLRILSMFSVLILHANGSLGIPVLNNGFTGALFRVFIESFCIIAVNVFVCLSGWFGINFSYKKLIAFLFQVLFFSFWLWVVFVLIEPSKALSLDGLKSVLLFNGSDLWFVKAYVFLYILSPFLNYFITYASQKEYTILLTIWIIIQIIYGWFQDASISFALNGTTGLSFAFLYLIMRYIRIYKYDKWKKYSWRLFCSCYLGISCIITLSVLIYFKLFGETLWVGGSRLWGYSNPLLIVSSLAVVMLFSKINISSQRINYVAKRCFAVYLFHCNFFIFAYYRTGVAFIYEHFYSFSIVVIFVYVCLVFLLSILLDNIRIFSWNKMSYLMKYA